MNVNIAGGLAAVAATVALLLAAPFTATAVAITPAQQDKIADNQAAFQCFIRICSARTRLLTVRKAKVTFYLTRFWNMHGVHGHDWRRCDQWAKVYTSGGYDEFRFFNCR